MTHLANALKLCISRTRKDFFPGASMAKDDIRTLEASRLKIALLVLFSSETCQQEEWLCQHLKEWPLVCNPCGQFRWTQEGPDSACPVSLLGLQTAQIFKVLSLLSYPYSSQPDSARSEVVESEMLGRYFLRLETRSGITIPSVSSFFTILGRIKPACTNLCCILKNSSPHLIQIHVPAAWHWPQVLCHELTVWPWLRSLPTLDFNSLAHSTSCLDLLNTCLSSSSSKFKGA